MSVLYSGKITKDILWEINSDRVLTIFGEGDMPDFDNPLQRNYDHLKEFDKLVIKEGITKIGAHAFEDFKNLRGDIIIPDSCQTIGYAAFCSCSNLDGYLELGDSTQLIGKKAFQFCDQLKGFVYLPDSMRFMGEKAFQHCKNIEGVQISPGMDMVASFAFYECHKLKDLYLPEGICEIQMGAFYGNENLGKVLTLPNSLEYVGVSAFYGCHSIEQINFGNNLRIIAEHAFEDCIGLKGDLKTNEILETVERYAFYNCQGLNGNVSLGKEMSFIGEHAFSKTNLHGTVPIGLSATIDEDAFADSHIVPDYISLDDILCDTIDEDVPDLMQVEEFAYE